MTPSATATTTSSRRRGSDVLITSHRRNDTASLQHQQPSHSTPAIARHKARLRTRISVGIIALSLDILHSHRITPKCYAPFIALCNTYVAAFSSFSRASAQNYRRWLLFRNMKTSRVQLPNLATRQRRNF